MADRPNILYVFSDQQSARMLSAAGNDDLATPHMDSIAAAGVRFENAYCSFPLCTPARASMFTGVYPHEMGMQDNGQPIAEELRPQGLGNLLREAGYTCAYGGKWHVPEIAMPAENEHGFEVVCGFDDRALPAAAADFIRRQHDRPWFLVASFDNPHNICEAARNQPLPWGPVRASPLEECPNLPVNHARGSYFPDVLAEEQAVDCSVYVGHQYAAADWRRLRDTYCRLTERVDDGLGVILRALRESGQAERTVVIYSSDHGDACGAHGWNQKKVLYDESARIPFLIQAPDAAPGRVEGRLVSNGLDLYPTVLDYAGVAVPPERRGRSLRPLVRGEEPAWRDHLVAETRFCGSACLGTLGRMVRTERYKYVVYSRGRNREQLFDLVADPGELVNLAVEARHRGTLQHCRDLLQAWCVETGDTFGHHYADPGRRFVPGHEYDHRGPDAPRVERPYAG